jgi:hypothetical protein
MAAHAVTLALLVVLACAPSASAGVLATPSFLTVNEGSPVAATYDLKLSASPGQDVIVHFNVPPGIQPIPDMPFTTSDYGIARTVEVRAWDDVVHLPTTTGQITHDVIPAGGGAPLITNDMPVAVFRNDNDYPMIFIDPEPAGTTWSEGDIAHWYARLGSRPASDVTLHLSVDPAQGTLLTPDITITPADWDQAHPIAVQLDDDSIDQSTNTRSIFVQVNPSTSADFDYDGRTASGAGGTFEDDDIAGVIFSPQAPTPVQVTEGGPNGTYRVRLATQPTGNVDISTAPLSTGQLTVSPNLLTFTATDWNIDQVVTITAIDDAAQEPGPNPDRILHTFNSSDAAYASPTAPDVYVNIVDNDTPAFLVTSPTSRDVSEADPVGTERTIAIRLATAPVGNVRVQGISGGQVGLVGASSLTFTPLNYATPQLLHVQAIDDTAAEQNPHPGLVSFSIVAANDPAYASQSIPGEVFNIADDDLANASLSCADGPSWSPDVSGRVPAQEDPAAADHTVGCYVQVGTPPTSDVVINLTTDVPGQLTISPATVTIPAGSSASQLLSITAVDDAMAEARPHLVRMTFGVTSGDPVYGTMAPAPVQFAIADNDVAGVKLTPPAPHSVAEGGAGLALAVSLTSQPASSVTLTPDAGSQLSLAAGASASLLFTPTNWNVPQSLQLSAVNDLVAEPANAPAPLMFTISSSDPTYQALPTPTFPIAVVDDDRAGVTMVPTGSETAVREGGTAGDTIGVKLSSQPTQDVTVTTDADAQIYAAPPTLTFTPANWNVAQDVTITAAQDPVYEGAHVGLLRLKLASADPPYDGGSPATPPPFEVKVADDDPAGATIVETEGATTVSESGGTDTYTIVLNAQPAADVVIKPNGAPQVTTQPAELVFTPANWNTPQTVTVTAVQDTNDEIDPHTVEIKHPFTTSATGWAGQTLASVTAKVADDDSASIVVTETEGSTRVAEGGATDKVTFRLSSQPASDVTLSPSGDVQLMIAKDPIVLTPANWNTAVELKVVAKNDEEDEGDHTGQLTVAVASTDPSYAKATINPIEVKISDDDGSDVTIQPGDGTGGDEGGTDGGTRTPRGTTDGGAGDGGSTDGSSSTTTSRTDGESGPADATTDEATDDGLDLGATTGAGTSGDTTAKEDPELDGEVVSATEKAPKRHAKKKPNPVQKAVRKAVDWTKDNQETVATVGGVGLMATGAGTFLLRGDPIKVAQRGLTALDGANKVPGSPKHRPHPRLRKAKKRKRDEEEEETAASGDGDGPGDDS